jgi:hypothetical protein
MFKQLLITTLAVFVAWSVLDFVIHSLILAPMYAETQNLWRPMEDMKYGVMYLVTLLSALAFVYIYVRFIGEKSAKTGTLYGLVFGLGAGVSMGYGSYAFMPLPYAMAFGWFLGTAVEGTVAGLLTGLLVKPPTSMEA